MIDHPITPPTDLLSRWEEDWHHSKVKHIELEDHIANQAAQWGADQELEACCAEMDSWGDIHYSSGRKFSKDLRYHRRPQPPSLKEQAIAALNEIEDHMLGPTNQEKLIRRALEALPND
jgi:hypothetical protein